MRKFIAAIIHFYILLIIHLLVLINLLASSYALFSTTTLTQKNKVFLFIYHFLTQAGIFLKCVDYGRMAEILV